MINQLEITEYSRGAELYGAIEAQLSIGELGRLLQAPDKAKDNQDYKAEYCCYGHSNAGLLVHCLISSIQC